MRNYWIYTSLLLSAFVLGGTCLMIAPSQAPLPVGVVFGVLALYLAGAITDRETALECERVRTRQAQRDMQNARARAEFFSRRLARQNPARAAELCPGWVPLNTWVADFKSPAPDTTL